MRTIVRLVLAVALLSVVPVRNAEAKDLTSQFPEHVKSLQAAYEAWAKDLPKPLWSNDKNVE